MMNHSCSALVTVYADAPGTIDAISAALETIGNVSIIAATDTELCPSPRTPAVSYRIVVCTPGDSTHPPARMELTEAECAHIRSVLERFGWRCSATAKALGIDRSTLYRKMKRFGISKDF
jgi:transcriptional regulator of acetoin/glycerol metabolism